MLDAIELIGIRTPAQAHVDPRAALQGTFDRAGVVDVASEVFARQQPCLKPVAEQLSGNLLP